MKASPSPYSAQIEKEQIRGELRDISRKSPLKGVS